MPNYSWIIGGAIGLIMGILAHLIMRSASALETLGTLIVGVAGAIAGFRLVPFGPERYGVFLIPAFIGGLLLALIWEMLFLGRRRSHVIGG